MSPRSWPVVACGVGCLLGCAAQSGDPSDSGPSDAQSGGSGQGGSAVVGAAGVPGSNGGGLSGSAGAGGAAGGASGAAAAGQASVAGASAGSGGAGGLGGSSSGAGAAAVGGSGGSKSGSSSLPFFEDFEDGQANGFIAWNDKSTAGPWVVVADGAGKVYQPQAPVSALEFGVGGSTTWTDVAMTVKVRLADDKTGAQVVARFKDAKTYLVVEMAVGKYKLRGRADGSTKDLVSPTTKPVIAAGTWYTVGITAKGTSVSLTLDGKPIGSPAQCDAAILSGGIALGVDEGSAAFDDVSVVAAP